LKGADTMVLAPLTQFQIGDDALHDGDEDTVTDAVTVTELETVTELV
jgi:hypothetical protein